MSQKDIRAMLKANPDGLTAVTLAFRMGKDQDNTRRQLQMMPDIFIRRWEIAPPRSPVPYVPVYKVVTVPENAPMPSAYPRRSQYPHSND